MNEVIYGVTNLCTFTSGNKNLEYRGKNSLEGFSTIDRVS